MLRRLSNAGEDSVYRRLAPAANRYKAEIYRKIRIADVMDIDGINPSLKSYALMAHFDFVIADAQQTPCFAIEFDGPGHSTANDRKKDDLCRREDLTLFRVNLPASRKQVGRLSLVDYLVHFWFLAQEFSRMQASGKISDEEPFMISGFLRADAKHIFDSEFDLLGPARSAVNACCKSRGIEFADIAHMSISELLVCNSDGEYLAFCSFPVDTVKLYGRASLGLKTPSLGQLKQVQFSTQEMGQFCTAMAIYDLLDQLKLYFSGERHIIKDRDEVLEEIRALEMQNFNLVLAFGTDPELRL